jgi:4-hydroxy-2-oxoheptanedioate aldolase
MQQGRMQFGAFLGLASPVVAEIASTAGFDWCLIDGEHGPNSIPLIQTQMMAMAASGTPIAVRVPVAEVWVVKQVLDLGAQSILVPMVDTPDQAEAMARAVRYAPEGNRGLAAGIVRASGHGAIPDYLQTANAQICLMVQAESRAAVANVDAIAAVDGVDCVFIGPSDLAADMGHPGNPAAPEVVAAIEHVIARTRAAGKAAAMFCLSPAEFAHYRDKGVTLLAVAYDVGTLASGLRAQAAQARVILGESD